MGFLDNIPWFKHNDGNDTPAIGGVQSSGGAGQVSRAQDVSATSRLPETISNPQNTPTVTDEFSLNDPATAELRELKERRETVGTRLNNAVAEYEQITTGTEPTLSVLKDDMNAKQEAYLKAVDESQNEEVKAIKEEIKETETNLSETRENIGQTEVVIQERKINIEETSNKISAKESLISSLSSKISEFRTQLQNTEGEENKDGIRAKIEQYQAQKGHEEAQKLTLETSKKSLEDQLKAEEQKKDELERKKQELEQKKQELDAKVLATRDETVKRALNEYNDATKKYQDEVQKFETQKAAALSDIEGAKAEIKALDAQIAAKEAEILEKKLIAEAKKRAEAIKIAKAKEAAGGGSSDVGPATAITGNDGAIDNQASNEAKIKELKQNVQQAKDELTAKETQLYGIYDGTNEDVKKAKEKRDQGFEAICTVLANGGKTSLANELRNDKKEVDRLEKDYYQKCKSVAQFESNSGISGSALTIINEKITALTEKKQNLESNRSTSSDATKVTEMITKVTEELADLTREKENLERTINNTEALNQLKEERNRAKALYEEADRKLNEKIENAVRTNSGLSGLSDAKTSYDTAKNEYSTKFTTAVETTTGEITSARARLKSASQTLGVAEGNYAASQYQDTSGIVNIASKYIGLNENNGSADIFWQKVGMNWSSRSMPWCAAFVSSVLMEAGVDLTGAYKNSVPGLMSFAKSKGKFISGSEANASNIKPGYAVFWKSHTGIVSKVYSDNTFDTIEGNCSNQVKECNRKYKMSQAAGFMAT
ncbi:MAG: CHAP domain-containing protein [Cyanobacteria bacterium RUI128]|nr:CHAP domain-containing protein [Cyanobacteria bacterium RUI128]